jgi:penicillin amidase
MIVNILEDVLIKLESKYGTSNISEWQFPIYTLTQTIPIFDEIGSLKSPEKFGWDYIPYMNRGTYNQIVEMLNLKLGSESDPPIGINVLPCGQSGFVKYPNIISPHAYDQLDLYLNWQFKPMLFNLSST